MTGLATALDHVGVVVRDVAGATAEWRDAGFAPTPGGRIMLRRGYIELLVQDPARPSATITAMLAAGEGAHVLSLATGDAIAAKARLRRAGFSTEMVENTRPGDADGTARFRRVPLTDALPRLQLIEHLTPEIVWHPPLLDQPNGAEALEEVVAVADPPAAFAAHLSRVAGRALAPCDGGFLLPLDSGRVRVLSPSAFTRIWQASPPSASLPRLASLVLRGRMPQRLAFPGLTVRLLAPGKGAPG